MIVTDVDAPAELDALAVAENVLVREFEVDAGGEADPDGDTLAAADTDVDPLLVTLGVPVIVGEPDRVEVADNVPDEVLVTLPVSVAVMVAVRVSVLVPEPEAVRLAVEDRDRDVESVGDIVGEGEAVHVPLAVRVELGLPVLVAVDVHVTDGVPVAVAVREALPLPVSVAVAVLVAEPVALKLPLDVLVTVTELVLEKEDDWVAEPLPEVVTEGEGDVDAVLDADAVKLAEGERLGKATSDWFTYGTMPSTPIPRAPYPLKPKHFKPLSEVSTQV